MRTQHVCPNLIRTSPKHEQAHRIQVNSERASTAPIGRRRTIPFQNAVEMAVRLTRTRSWVWNGRPTKGTSRKNVGHTHELLLRTDYRLAMILHPDSSHPASSHTDFATLHRAYTLLSRSSSRQQYLSSGYGWSGRSDGSGPSFDDAMRAEVMRRRAGGAAAYGGSYRRSDAGQGAWGGYGMGGAWTPNPEDGFPEQGKGEALYMSNERAMTIFIAVVSHPQFPFLSAAQDHIPDVSLRDRLTRSAVYWLGSSGIALPGRQIAIESYCGNNTSSKSFTCDHQFTHSCVMTPFERVDTDMQRVNESSRSAKRRCQVWASTPRSHSAACERVADAGRDKTARTDFCYTCYSSSGGPKARGKPCLKADGHASILSHHVYAWHRQYASYLLPHIDRSRCLNHPVRLSNGEAGNQQECQDLAATGPV